MEILKNSSEIEHSQNSFSLFSWYTCNSTLGQSKSKKKEN